MKKSFSIVFLTLAMVMMVIPGKSLAQKKPAQGKIPPLIGVASAGVGSAGHSMAVAYAPIMQKYFGTPVRVLPAWSAGVNLSQIKDRKAHFIGGGASQSMAVDAIVARDFFANHEWGPQEVGTVWHNYACPYGIMVRGDSNIKTLADLKGKKAAIYLVSPAWRLGLEACLAFAGLSLKDVQTVEVGGYDQTARAVADGRADFTYNAPISTVTIEVAENPYGIRYLPMDLKDKAGWDRFWAVRSDSGGAICTTGVKAAIGVPMVNSPFVVWTYKWVDQDFVYQLAKFFSEQNAQYKALHPNLPEMSFEAMVKFKETAAAIPILPGTVRYLKEKGKWNASDEKWNDAQWATQKKLIELWDKAEEEANSKKIRIDYKNKAWMDLWEKSKAEIPPFKARLK
ncbi:MAG: TAXI family TRAP transporter solute-binding subunit [Deltaproteobacteria bacterium]|nr:TAXI family TRAP transporter solute-binding subunit [Deltaproteobacteria bacterium]